LPGGSSSPPATAGATGAVPGEDADLTDLAFQLGALSWNVNDRMKVGKVFTVTASIVGDRASASSLPSGPQEDIQVTNKMEMELRPDQPDAFTINPPGPTEQLIEKTNPTTWTWDVTPLRPGTHVLHLITWKVYKTGKKSVSKDKVIVVEANVTGSITGFVGRNWQWLWTVIVFPTLGYLWHRAERKKRVHKKKTTAPHD
jgi:hypothetical protein